MIEKQNPYRFIDDGLQRIVNVSGGRSSGFMLWQILQAHGGELPGNAKAVFCNTGKERNETLDFVRDIEAHWAVPITWLEYRYDAEAELKNHYAVVDHQSASRNGEPFDQLICQTRMLPSPLRRVCTSELKVATMERYAYRALGCRKSQYRSIIGLRYDEARRWRKAMKDGCHHEYPMVLAKATRADVDAFWKRRNFDLAIPSELGNCDLCFLKGKRKLISAIRNDPHLADWWIAHETRVLEMERVRGLRKREMSQFNDKHSYGDLLIAATSNAELPLDDGQAADCFCSD